MKVIKKAIKLSFRRAIGAEVIQTLEGPVTAQLGDAVLTGTKGEVWPINASKFQSTYNFDEESGICFKKPIIVDAVKQSEPFSVKVGWAAEPLQGKAGDFLLAYGEGDFGVVDADIFAETYDIV